MHCHNIRSRSTIRKTNMRNEHPGHPCPQKWKEGKEEEERESCLEYEYEKRSTCVHSCIEYELRGLSLKSRNFKM